MWQICENFDYNRKIRVLIDKYLAYEFIMPLISEIDCFKVISNSNFLIKVIRHN